jgi:DNA invertase Pin-like site-specific DNA recombinase
MFELESDVAENAGFVVLAKKCITTITQQRGEPRMHAVVYFRCSGSGQLSGDTFERQRDSVRAFALSNEYTIDQEFIEAAVPGKTDIDGRPAFQEMIATLLANGCRTVIVEGLDRLARSFQIQEQLLIYLSSKGISLISANTGENITDAMMGDPMRRAMVQIQGVLSELDKNMIVSKLRKARERKRARGERCEGRTRYGTTSREADTLRYMLVLSKNGDSPEEIASTLNRQLIPTRMGKRWHAATVSKILKRQQAAA